MTAPLREIVGAYPHEGHHTVLQVGEEHYGLVVLECGHFKWWQPKDGPHRTRCLLCREGV